MVYCMAMAMLLGLDFLVRVLISFPIHSTCSGYELIYNIRIFNLDFMKNRIYAFISEVLYISLHNIMYDVRTTGTGSSNIYYEHSSTALQSTKIVFMHLFLKYYT